jgi:hypothetical protein
MAAPPVPAPASPPPHAASCEFVRTLAPGQAVTVNVRPDCDALFRVLVPSSTDMLTVVAHANLAVQPVLAVRSRSLPTESEYLCRRTDGVCQVGGDASQPGQRPAAGEWFIRVTGNAQNVVVEARIYPVSPTPATSVTSGGAPGGRAGDITTGTGDPARHAERSRSSQPPLAGSPGAEPGRSPPSRSRNTGVYYFVAYVTRLQGGFCGEPQIIFAEEKHVPRGEYETAYKDFNGRRRPFMTRGYRDATLIVVPPGSVLILYSASRYYPGWNCTTHFYGAAVGRDFAEAQRNLESTKRACRECTGWTEVRRWPSN